MHQQRTGGNRHTFFACERRFLRHILANNRTKARIRRPTLTTAIANEDHFVYTLDDTSIADDR
jgi:hypothetical protein